MHKKEHKAKDSITPVTLDNIHTHVDPRPLDLKKIKKAYPEV